MSKSKVLLVAPVTSRSGYGNHARDVAISLINNDSLEVYIQDVPWGACPKTALNESTENNLKMKQCFLEMKNLQAQPDIYIDLRIPNEFEQHGKFNIGMTAGIETNAVSPKWIECCNKMDLVITTSEHSKGGFTQSTYDQLKQLPNGQQEKVGTLKLEKPVKTLFEGADTETYKKVTELSKDVNELFTEISEDFTFLFVGQWTKGGYGEDRKDIAKMIKIFIEAFANKKQQPALILKTNGATTSILDREECLEKINAVKNLFPKDWKLPKIYLIHGEFTDVEMNELYNHPKVKAMISFTHGEGFGRPLLEATMVGLPVIASGWSGQLDFLDSTKSILISGELKEVPQSQHWENIIIPESKWFNISENHAYQSLVSMFNDYEVYKSKANELMNENKKKFTLDKMSEALATIIEETVPKPVSLKLPKLKLGTENKSSKIKLPNLSDTLTEGVQ
tara:strand:- start:937 stop:2289 length:1353 start_codon:yes stop_codon:yes gene_type:complete